MKALEFKVIAKAADKRRVYGYASVVKTVAGAPVVDLQGDVIFADDLEAAAAEFVKEWRQGGEMHTGRAPNDLIASLVFTEEIQKALGIPEGLLPVGWFVGFEVPEATFEKIQKGTRLMFSIEGEADREEIEVPA